MTDRFFLGGRDLEMIEIAALVRATRGDAALCDKGLAWGARMSDYREEIAATHAAGRTPVAVELADDMPADWPARARLVLIDHHGPRAQEPAALRQVFDRLALPEARWTREMMLVAANDVGHARAMRAAGASLAEMAAIRARDRAAQGISAAEEATGRAALAAGRPVLAGQALLVRLPHARSATVVDPLALDSAFAALPRHLVIASPGTVQVFGPRLWIDALARRFPQGWSGGQGAEGFFGCRQEGEAPLMALLATIEQADGKMKGTRHFSTDL